MRKKIPTLVFAGVIAVVLATLVGLGAARLISAHLGDPSLIHACVSNASGTVKIVGPTGTCNINSETALDWNITGPAGPQGPEGPQGPAGPPGPQGLPGVSNLQRISNQATSGTGSFLLVSASCTGGRVVLGGGASASNSNVNVWINQPGVGLNDAGGPGGWTGGANVLPNVSVGFTLTVYAICANVAQ